MNQGMHFFIEGKVQGVFFRAYTQEAAKQYHLTGWIRNLSDGRVEVNAFGSEKNINKLYVWLKKGSPQANVSKVAKNQIPWASLENFLIKS